jgi:hypothetical protein
MQSVTATPLAPTSASRPVLGRARFESRIQNVASPSSIVSPARIAATPQPVGRTNSASAMAMIRAI